jgi:DnaK suppressor protein
MTAETKIHHTDSHQVLRDMLLQLQREAYQRIKALRRDQQQELETEPVDDVDSANASAEVETHAGLIAREEEKLRYLDEAITRLDAGKYGTCMECGAAIPIERLMAIPFVSYCLKCQEKHNRTQPGWGEGTIIPPYDHQWTLPGEMEDPEEPEYQITAAEEQLTINGNGLFAGERQTELKRSAAKKSIRRGKR